jgi:hypothetical protein
VRSLEFDAGYNRRRFLQFLAASPLFAGLGPPAVAQDASAPSRLPDPMPWAPRELDNLISDPKGSRGTPALRRVDDVGLNFVPP